MKRLLTLLALGLFVGGSIVGCEANAKVGDPDTTSSTSSGTTYSKKTTTVREPDGDRTTKTEVKTNSNY